MRRSTVAERQLTVERIKTAKVEREAETVDPDIIWEREFEKFKKNKLYNKFYQITDSFYKFGGQTRVNKFSVGSDILLYADANGLIELEPGEYDTRLIKPTQKGRVFFKLFSEDPESLKEGTYDDYGREVPF